MKTLRPLRVLLEGASETCLEQRDGLRIEKDFIFRFSVTIAMGKT